MSQTEDVAVKNKKAFDLIIVGGGPAGYSAAVYAARSSLNVAVIEQGMPGGQIATTDMVENYPGIPEISGAELGDLFRKHAEALGSQTMYDMVTTVSKTDGGFVVEGGDGPYTASSLIIATGAQPRQAGFVGEDTYRGRGVSYCATCDGMFYRNKRVYVIGGGNAACEEALYLSHFVKEVIMVVRRDVFRAPKGVVDRLLERDNVTVRYQESIIELAGDTMPTSITFRHNDTQETYTENLEAGSFGIFVFAGTKPVTDLFEPLVELAPDGGIKTDEQMATCTPGLYAAGDVRSKGLRQVITAASDGAIAATSVYKYLLDQQKL